MVKLSKHTVDVLKNFASINSNIAFSTGKELKTVSISKNLMGKAGINEKFPYPFGIYDLNEFIGVMGMFEDPDLQFDDNKKFVTFKDANGASVKYYFSDIEHLVTSDATITLPDVSCKFNLSLDQLNAIRRASATLKADSLIVKTTPTGIKATVTEDGNPTSNEYSFDIDGTSNNDNSVFKFSISNFKFVNTDDYEFEISSKHIASIKSSDDMQYWLALEK